MLKRLIPLALLVGTVGLPSCSEKEVVAPKSPTAQISHKDAANTNALGPGESLERGQTLYSNNGVYTLVMQEDGNLVLYKYGSQVLWVAYDIYAGLRLVMQTDGNLVFYGNNISCFGSGCPPITATFASNTAGQAGAYRVLQDDGNLVVYQNGQALWNSGPAGR